MSSKRTAVTVTHSRIVVSAPGARAVITRNPFRLAVQGADGAPAVREVANTRPAPLVVPPTVDPVPPGTDNQATPSLYAPLSFLVGSESFEQYPSSVWAGNLKSGTRTGVWYSPTRVTGVERGAGGVRLRLATSDPSGRRLEVTVAPVGARAVGVTATAHPAGGVAEMSDSFASGADEGFFGFGGRYGGLDQRGRVLSSWVQEENIAGPSGVTGVPRATALYPNGLDAAFYPQAEFVSSRPYGFLLDQPQLARFKLAADRRDAWNVAAVAPSLRYVVAPGSGARAIGTLTALSGRQPPPPRWALGPQLDRLVKNFTQTRSDYEANLEADLENIDRYHLPLKGYRIEGWGFEDTDNDGLVLYDPPVVRFAVQSKLIAELRARRIHPISYLRPFIAPGSAPDRAGLAVRDANGQTYTSVSTTGKRIALLDFTNPAAVRFWSREVAKMLDLGFDGFMADFGEEVLLDMHFHNGETGVAMHNRYPIVYARATRKAIAAYERAHPHRRIWVYNRSGYTGIPGSAKYEGGNVPGDESTYWGRGFGLRGLTSDMLNRAIGGAYGYTTDIGGYYDYATPPTTKELFIRWAEWAALSPMFRLHGSGRTGTHTPWSFDRQAVKIYNGLSRLHERAVPLILRLWRHAHSTGIPPTRPLWLSYPRDRASRSQDQEWLLGRNVLVAPVVQEGATSRVVYFPTGCWRAPGGGETHRGSRSVRVPAPLTRLPYYFRCGTHPFRPDEGLRRHRRDRPDHAASPTPSHLTGG